MVRSGDFFACGGRKVWEIWIAGEIATGEVGKVVIMVRSVVWTDIRLTVEWGKSKIGARKINWSLGG